MQQKVWEREEGNKMIYFSFVLPSVKEKDDFLKTDLSKMQVYYSHNSISWKENEDFKDS